MMLYQVKHIVHIGKTWHTNFWLENFMEKDHFEDQEERKEYHNIKTKV
jgi:hypothetical protein